MMKKRILMMLMVIAVVVTSIPVPAMAETAETVTEISVTEVSENSVSDDIEPETNVQDLETSMENYEKKIASMNGYVPDPDYLNTTESVSVSAGRVAAERMTSVSLPSKYDPRPDNKVSAVREQVGGTCWLFSSVAAIESNLIHQGLADHTIDLSEFQIAYFLFHPYEDPLGYYTDNTGKGKNNSGLTGDTLWDYMEGGGEGSVITFLETGVSPVYEEEAPFFTNQEEDAYGEMYYTRPTKEEINARVLDESLTDKKYFRLKDTHDANINDRAAVKQLIMDYGAVSTGYYSVASKGIVREEGGEFSYYSGYSHLANHAIAIVGWDDNYSAENFINTPPGNGAWLCKNSAGPNIKDFNGTTSNGYEWISYYEPTLIGAYAFEMEAGDLYENIYHEPDGGVLLNSDVKINHSLDSIDTVKGKKRTIAIYTAKAYADGSAERVDFLEVSNYFDDIWDDETTLYLNPVVEGGEIVSYSYKWNPANNTSLKETPFYIPSGSTFGIYHERTPQLYEALGEEWKEKGDVITGFTNRATMQCSTSVTLSNDTLTLKQGETSTLTATVLPANTTMKGVSYHTTDKNIAVVDENGVVTPCGSGSCEIVVKAWDGKSSARCMVTVRASSVDLENTTVGIGQNTELTPVYEDGFLGEGADKYSWSVSDTSLATIDNNGVITGIKKGSVTVSAYLKEDPAVKATCSVKVVQPATGITFGLAGLSMTMGESKKITASILPADADQTIEYKLEDAEGVVTYENGVLTAVSSGAAVLTATVSGTNISEKLYIDVYPPASYISYGTEANVSLKAGETSILSFWVTASNPFTYHEILSATSSNERVVKVIQKPYITYNGGNAACTIQAVAPGTATITIKSNDSRGETLVYKITVTGGSGSGNSGNISKPETITSKNVVYSFVGNEMMVIGAVGDAKRYTIKSMIYYGGKRYYVTAIGDGAFKNHSKLTKITIPSKVTSIGKNAFYNCKNLKTVTINSKVLTSVGKKAFKKIKKNASIKVPKKKYKDYKKLLKGKTDKSTQIKK